MSNMFLFLGSRDNNSGSLVVICLGFHSTLLWPVGWKFGFWDSSIPTGMLGQGGPKIP